MSLTYSEARTIRENSPMNILPVDRAQHIRRSCKPLRDEGGRFDKLSIAFYLAMGWSGALAYDKAAASLPSLILALIAAGGGLYTMGVLFHSWERLRFRNAIWHGFVILGAGCHFTAVVGLVTA
jgi:predicted membrane channel-forming protein YqfA (hemolysin III family)